MFFLPLLLLIPIDCHVARHVIDVVVKPTVPQDAAVSFNIRNPHNWAKIVEFATWNTTNALKSSGRLRIPLEFKKVVLELEDVNFRQREVLLNLDNLQKSFLTIQSDDYRLKIATQTLKFAENSFNTNDDGCSCVKGNCACCLDISIPEFQHSVCVNATYNPVSIGLDLSIGVDGHYFSEEISLRNPPPICGGLPIPGAEHIVGACVAFTDLDIDKTEKILSGCVEFEVELIHLRVLHFKIGCFRMPI